MGSGPSLPRRILITGGAGFVGSNLAREILRRRPDAELTILDDLSSGSEERLREIGPGARWKWVRHDLGAAALPREILGAPFEAVFHLAAITDTTVTDEKKMRRTNVEGSRRLFEYALERNIPLVYASSAAVYGITDRRCAEDGPKKPANIYGVSKLEAEGVAGEYAGNGARLAGVRYFNVYGPGETHKGKFGSMIWQLSLQIRAGKRPRVFKHGEQKRDFVHVEDAVDATIRALAAPSGSVCNVGSGRGRSFNEVIAALNAALGTRLEPEYFDCPYDFFQPFTEADIAKAARELGYKPKYALEGGIKAYMDVVRYAS